MKEIITNLPSWPQIPRWAPYYGTTGFSKYSRGDSQPQKNVQEMFSKKKCSILAFHPYSIGIPSQLFCQRLRKWEAEQVNLPSSCRSLPSKTKEADLLWNVQLWISDGDIVHLTPGKNEPHCLLCNKLANSFVVYSPPALYLHQSSFEYSTLPKHPSLFRDQHLIQTHRNPGEMSTKQHNTCCHPKNRWCCKASCNNFYRST